MNKSNYRIYYSPRKGICGHNVTVEVSEEFIEFAKQQKVNKKEYEKIGLEMIRACGWPNFTRKDIQHAPSICGWVENTGLLFYINVPGNAAGVALEETVHGWTYLPHNMGSIGQAAVVLGLMSQYLFDIETRISKE